MEGDAMTEFPEDSLPRAGGDNASPRITPGRMLFVHCDDPETHPGKRARLEIFSRNDDGEWHSWPQRSYAHLRRAGVAQERHAVHYLDTAGGVVAGGPELYPDPDEPSEPLRRRYEIECPICGRRLVVRSETLERVLDSVAHRIDDAPLSLPLRWLAARVGSK